MKCEVCKQEISHESESVVINGKRVHHGQCSMYMNEVSAVMKESGDDTLITETELLI